MLGWGGVGWGGVLEDALDATLMTWGGVWWGGGGGCINVLTTTSLIITTQTTHVKVTWKFYFTSHTLTCGF